jgi:RNA polymerase sigma-70 factor, ECF subfamily
VSSESGSDLSLLLRRVSDGDAEAVNELIPVAYAELRRIAANRLRAERAGHTLQPTALVNEAFLRLFGQQAVAWQNRAHFFAVAARQMRFILVDYARHRQKGGGMAVSLDGLEGIAGVASVQTDEDLVALDEALGKLEAIDPQAARGVELRFFGGLTLEEVAAVQKINVATVKRDWVFAKSWLYSQLAPQPPQA